MSSTSANMGLTQWDSLDDAFSHLQLSDNFAAIDVHDHSSGKGVQVGTGGIAPLAIGTTQIQDSAVTNAKIPANTITGDRIQDGSLSASKITSSSISTVQIGQLPQCRAYSNANFSIPNTTVTPIQFTGTYLNTPTSMWDVSVPTQLVASVSGVYLVAGSITWATSASGTVRRLLIRRNTTDFTSGVDLIPNAVTTWQHLSSIVYLAAGDYIEICAYQNTGGAINVTVNANQDAPEGRLIWLSS